MIDLLPLLTACLLLLGLLIGLQVLWLLLRLALLVDTCRRGVERILAEDDGLSMYDRDEMDEGTPF